MSFDYGSSGYRNYRSQPNYGSSRNDRRFYDERRTASQERRPERRTSPYSEKPDFRPKGSETGIKRALPNYSLATGHLPSKRSYNHDRTYGDVYNQTYCSVEDKQPSVRERIFWNETSSESKTTSFGNAAQYRYTDRGTSHINPNKNQSPKENQRVITVLSKNTKINEGCSKRLEREKVIINCSSTGSNIQNRNVELYQNTAINLTSQTAGSGSDMNRRDSASPSSRGYDSDTTVKNTLIVPKVETASSTPASPRQNTSLVPERKGHPDIEHNVSTSSNRSVYSGRNIEVSVSQAISVSCTPVSNLLTSLANRNLSYQFFDSFVNQPNMLNDSKSVMDDKNKPLNIPEQNDNVTSSESVMQSCQNESVEYRPTNSTQIDSSQPPQSTPAKPKSPNSQPQPSSTKPLQSIPVVQNRAKAIRKNIKVKSTSKVVSFKVKGTCNKTVKKPLLKKNKKLKNFPGNCLPDVSAINNALNTSIKNEPVGNYEDNIAAGSLQTQPSTSNLPDVNTPSFQLQNLLDALIEQLRCQTCQNWMSPAEVRSCLCHLLCEACATCSPGCLDCGKIREANDKVSNFFSRIANVIPHPCPNMKNGCGFLVKPGDNHIASCDFRGIQCFGCQKHVLLKELPEHIKVSHPTSKVLKEVKNMKILPTHLIENQSSSGQCKEFYIFCNKSDHSFWITMSRDTEKNVDAFRVDPVSIVESKKVTVKFDFKFKNYSKTKSCAFDKSRSTSIVINKDVIEDWFSGQSTLDIYIMGRTIIEK